MSSEKLKHAGPQPLQSVAVDLTNRLGDVARPTPVGLSTLEHLLVGGLRTGDFLTIGGPSGSGKTSLALFLAYIAARSKAAALVVSPTLTEDEVLARFASRALHRERPAASITYGDIWSGAAWRDALQAGAARAAVDTVVKKVGAFLHVVPTTAFTPVQTIERYAAALWHKHSRVVLVVDNLEAFVASGEGRAGGRVGAVVETAYAFRQLAQTGCAVIATVAEHEAPRVAPAATLATELLPSPDTTVGTVSAELARLGARNVDLVVHKNRIGRSGRIPLRFVAGVATFEERAP